MQNWSTEITYKGESRRSLTAAIRLGIREQDHDDFWIAEISDGQLMRIWHTDESERTFAEESELRKVASALECSYA